MLFPARTQPSRTRQPATLPRTLILKSCLMSRVPEAQCKPKSGRQEMGLEWRWASPSCMLDTSCLLKLPARAAGSTTRQDEAKRRKAKQHGARRGKAKEAEGS